MFVGMVVLSVLWHTVVADLECAVDERKVIYNSNNGKVLLERKDLSNVDDCYKSCCALRGENVPCNAASFFKQGDDMICLNIQCEPFSACNFDPSITGHSAKLALFNTTVDFDVDESGLNGLVQESVEEENEEKINEEIGEYFDKDNEVNKWNVDYSDQLTTTPWEGFIMTSTPFKGYEETTTMSQKKEHGETSDQSNILHANTGIYGPNQVDDLEYSTTPLLVIGAVVTVLFLLIVLIFVGRKLSASERLKYRPLMDNLPSSNSYHDIE